MGDGVGDGMAGTDGMRIAVVGAGIAGLTVAAILLRSGVHCQVFEQTPRLGEVGAGVQIAPNAARIPHRLGLGRYLRRVAVRPRAVEMRRWNDNQPLRRTPLGEECEAMYGAPYYAVHRADLHQGLLGLLPEGTVQLGLRCTRVSERTDGVELLFSGGSTATADVVVGADGIHSAVRDALVTDEPTFSGQTIYRGLVPASRLPFLLEEPKVVLWLGPDQHCVCYPIAGGKLISFGATTPAGDWHTAGRPKSGRSESWSAKGRVQDLVAAYSGWSDEVMRVITAADTVSRWALHDRDIIERWSTGRITIAGDAAHPMLPFMAQGANQAIEDAAVLAACLRRTATGTVSGGVAAALRRYEELRKPRTDRIHQMSRTNSRVFHLGDGDQQRHRDGALGGSSGLRDQQWLYGYDAELAASA